MSSLFSRLGEGLPEADSLVLTGTGMLRSMEVLHERKSSKIGKPFWNTLGVGMPVVANSKGHFK